MGPSGCGKSTLLNIIGGLDRPTSGVVTFEGRDVHSMSEPELARYRNRSIGFVFQLHHLLPQCTVLENVLVPSLVNPDAGDAHARALELIERVGLSDRAHYRPGVLSGGERQRVAVARALENRPSLLLADEPTGSLSEEGSRSLTGLLNELNRDFGMALIVVTHSPAVAKTMSRVYELSGGDLHPASFGVEA
jgi:ABC-type lipoprotein export system ATPase subunit